MGRKRVLKSGARRVLADHSGADGRAFDAHYKALVARLGPFDEVCRAYASGVAACWIEWQRSTRDLDRARHNRETGTGRRPNQGAIQRLQKRQGLAWQSYDSALHRLAELASTQRAPADDLARHLASQHARPEGP